MTFDAKTNQSQRFISRFHENHVNTFSIILPTNAKNHFIVNGTHVLCLLINLFEKSCDLEHLSFLRWIYQERKPERA